MVYAYQVGRLHFVIDSPDSGNPNSERWKQFGFLVADLFMVLMLVFLIITISMRGQVQALDSDVARLNAQVATQTPVEATLSAQNTALRTAVACQPRLSTTSVSLVLHVSWQDLLAGASSAQADVVNQVASDGDLKGARAGLVITYGGAPDQSTTSRAKSVAQQVNTVLKTQMGGAGQPFQGAAFHDPQFYLGYDYSFVYLEMYLYDKTICPTVAP